MGLDILGFGLGRSRSRSSSSSSSNSQSSSNTSQDVFLADLYASLYSDAQGAAEGINTAGITGAANDLFQTGSGFIDELGGTDGGFVQNPVTVGGVDMIDTPGSTAADEIAMLQSDLGRLFTEELNPAITSEAVAGRSLGGGRQGIAQGEAMGRVADAFVRGRNDIRSRDIDRQLTVDTLNQRAQLESLGLNLEADQFNETLASEYDLRSRGLDIAGLSAALGYLPNQFDLAAGGANAELSPYLMLAQVLGDPTVLTQAEAQSTSRSRGTSSSSSRSFNFGAQS